MRSWKGVLRPLSLIVSILFISGCSTTLGPERVALSDFKRTPLLQLGQVNETLSGTWAATAPAGFKNAVINALKQPPASTLFTPDEKALPVEIDFNTDHEDDGPRLNLLGLSSACTLGLIPLTYLSQWKVTGKAIVRKNNGPVVAEFPLETTGTYSVAVFPLTMFALLGCAMRGNEDGLEIQRRCANNLASQLMMAVDAHYTRLVAAFEGNAPEGAAASSTEGAGSPAPAAKVPDLM